jgi:hypothetical protein
MAGLTVRQVDILPEDPGGAGGCTWGGAAVGKGDAAKSSLCVARRHRPLCGGAHFLLAVNQLLHSTEDCPLMCPRHLVKPAATLCNSSIPGSLLPALLPETAICRSVEAHCTRQGP